jgi:hypothetical protein
MGQVGEVGGRAVKIQNDFFAVGAGKVPAIETRTVVGGEDNLLELEVLDSGGEPQITVGGEETALRHGTTEDEQSREKHEQLVPDSSREKCPASFGAHRGHPLPLG